MAFFDRNRSLHPSEVQKGDDRTLDGKFKLGPANAQRKLGDTAFEAAKGHIDSAKDAAKSGDEQAADFHVGMAQQYATLGCKNHMMGKYTDDMKGKTPMPMLAQTQTAMRKAEDEIARLKKNWDEWNAAHHGSGSEENASNLAAGKTYHPVHGWETQGERANRENPYPTGAAAKNLGTTKEEWAKGNETGGANFAQAIAMGHEHYAMGNMHNDKSLSTDGEVASAHMEASNAHGIAQHHFNQARDSYTAGQRQIGDEQLGRGIAASHAAKEASGHAMMAEMRASKK